MTLLRFMFDTKMVMAGGEARRLARWSKICINGEPVASHQLQDELQHGDAVSLRAKHTRTATYRVEQSP